MTEIKNGRRFSSEFSQATEVNEQTMVLIQTPNNPVQKAQLGQIKEVVNRDVATQGDLAQTQRDLAQTQGDLEQTKSDLEQTKSDLEQTQSDLEQTQSDLEQTQSDLAQTQSDLAQTQSDLAQTKQEINAKEEKLREDVDAEYAKKDGAYPKMTVGFAQEIVGDGSATTEEFSFRPTAGEERNVANTIYYEGERNGVARIDKVKGNTVVWNQLVNTDTTSVDLIANHKYITNINGTISLQSPTSATTINVSGDTDKVTDLTQMFGAGNEPTTVEEFYERLPKGVNISAYNARKIVDGNYGAIKTVGFNQWDEQWENGGISLTTGINSSDRTRIRSKNYNLALPNVMYYFRTPVPQQRLIFWYDVEYNFIKYSYYSVNANANASPSNARYFKILLYEIYGTTYKNDICINLAWDEYAFMNGMYQPYKPFERDLSWVNKYFPATINGETKYGMRSSGSARDEFRFNYTTQKWEAVQNVGVRAYAEGDNENPSVITDGTNTNYTLVTPIVTEIEEDINMDFDVSDYGTEELLAEEGKASAPIVADIAYAPNALSTIKQVPDILKRLKALESAMAQQTTNVEPSNIEE